MEPSPLQPGSLQQHEESIFGLQELVDVANGLLPAYLPKDAAGRAADDVNPRLVRFYTTEGLIPEPHKEGREARYVYDHLLALLLVRKLMAEGFGSAAIRKALSGRQRSELEALLQDEVRIELAPSQSVAQAGEGVPGSPTSAPTPITTSSAASPAAATSKADFLRQVRARAGLGTEAAEPLGYVVGGSSPRGRPHEQRLGAPLSEPAVREKSQTHQRGALGEPDASAHAEPSAWIPYRPAPPGVGAAWYRLLVHDGLELSVRDDFTWPANHVAEEQLLQQMRVALLQLEQARKKQRS